MDIVAFLTAAGLAFVPLLVAIDPAGCVPVFLGLTQGADPVRVRRIVNQATLVSLIIATVFALSGSLIFDLLGMRTSDFQIGGGLLLFAFALTDLLATGRRMRRDNTAIGIVPLATPLIAGPALLTTIILAVAQHGTASTLAALVLNLGVVWAALSSATWLASKVGNEILNGVSKVLMVLMAGYGVMMVRTGLMQVFAGH
jgi:multiple antibiotic resistance protein